MSVDAAPAVAPLAPLVRGRPVVGPVVVGPVVDLLRDRLGLYERAHRECGDVARITVGPPGRRQSLHLVMHPDGVQHVLAAGSRAYGKDSPVYRELRAYIGSGLLTSQDDDWNRQKRLIQPIFTARRVAGYAPAMASEAEALVSLWRADAEAGRAVDLHGGSMTYTLRVVGRLLFGAALEEVIDVLDRTAEPIQRHLLFRGLSPVRVPRHWPTPGGRRADHHRRQLYSAVDAVIARAHEAGEAAAAGGAVDRRARSEGAGTDLLTLLLEARDPVDGSALSRDEVRDQVLVFMLAGHETTANALIYTFHLLGRHQEIQERVRAEAATAGDDVLRLPYTTQVVQEALRLYPPACQIGRSVRADDVVLEHRVHAGDVVVLPVWVVHRDPRWWPDPLRFDPDRFAAEASAGRHRYAYLPFGGGPRACIGARFALLEAAAAVAAVTRAFRVTAVADLPALFPGVTLRPRSPVLARLDPRPG